MYRIKNPKRNLFYRCLSSLVVLFLLGNVVSCGNGTKDQRSNAEKIFDFAMKETEATNSAEKSNNYEIKESGTIMSLDTGGNVDESSFLWPNMPSQDRFVSSIMIRNTGGTVVVNPRLSINGFKLPLTTAELLTSITNDSKDPLERLLRIFYTFDRYSVHEDLGVENWQDSPLEFFIGYGGGLCHDRANIQRMLWDLLGHRSRNSQAKDHTAYEVEYGNRIMHLDTDIDTFYLMHDNWTGASSLDILNDPMLILRAVNYRDYHKYPIKENDPEPNMWSSSEKVAAMFGDRERGPLYSRPPVYEEFRILLKPGEGYSWNTDKPNHIHPIFTDSPLSDVVRDVTWETRLDFSKAVHRWPVQKTGDAGVSIRDNIVILDKNTKIVLSYGYPFPLTGGDLILFPKANAPDVSIHLSIHGGSGGVEQFDIPLNELTSGNNILRWYIQNLSYPVHNLQMEISLSDSGSNDNKEIPLEGLLFRLYSQGTTYAFPSLKAGRNDLVYSDASNQRLIEVQVSTIPLQTALPGFPLGSQFSPGDNTWITENDLAFSWPKSTGSVAKGYQIQISAFPDMRYPLSPSFERIVYSSDVTESHGMIEYKLPWRGMLPVNRELYWRVRPFRGDLLAGQWSGILAFKVKGPQSPEQIRIEYDQGRIILSWSASPSGTQPQYYEIHSSSLEGFIPMSEPHRLLGFGDQTEAKYEWGDVTATDWPVVPETTLTTTKGTSIILYDKAHENPDWFSKLGSHLRVIAIDSAGSRSCPSPQAHIQSPLINIPSVGRITTQLPYFLGLWNEP
jgi:hypothetical protein